MMDEYIEKTMEARDKMLWEIMDVYQITLEQAGNRVSVKTFPDGGENIYVDGELAASKVTFKFSTENNYVIKWYYIKHYEEGRQDGKD